MLLRESSKALGESADLAGTVGEGDGGVEHGAALISFAEAATRGDDSLGGTRSQLLDDVGPPAFVEAAATVAAFNGLVRVADATGIPLDQGTARASVELRDQLGLNAYAGALSTPTVAPDSAAGGSSVRDLFVGSK